MSNHTCGLQKSGNSTNLYGFTNAYAGIPQNLLTNLILFSILLTLFLILRKSAWKVVNRLVPQTDRVSKWYHMFFSQVASSAHEKFINRIVSRKKSGNDVENQVERDAQEDEPDRGHQGISENDVAIETTDEQDEIQTSNLQKESQDVAQSDSQDNQEASEEILASPDLQQQPRRTRVMRQHTLSGQSFNSWLVSIFTMDDADIEMRCGSDALQYLRFQRYILIYLSVVTIIAICIILPLNFQGTLQGDKTSFEHTTIVNLDPKSNFLWAHVIFSFLFFPLAIIMMRKFSVPLEFHDTSLEVTRTLIIDNIPKEHCQMDKFRQYFRETHPNEIITDLKFAYDVDKLLEMQKDLESMQSAKEYCELNPSSEISLYPVSCSRCCPCFCCCCHDQVDGLSYYRDEEARLEEELVEEKQTSVQKPLGILFITFQSLNMSKEVFDQYQTSFFKRKNPYLKETSLTKLLGARSWEVTFATTPNDIYWENLSKSQNYLLIKKVVINFFLFLVAFFLTTPEIVASQAEAIVAAILNITEEEVGEKFVPPWLISFLPTLMLWSFTALMPLLVAWSDRLLGHWTRSVENHAIMKKTFWYLLFMVILFPVFGLTTAKAVFDDIISSLNGNENDPVRWECIFLPDSGAFFVNYVITASLAGAGFELIRLPEMLFYSLQVCMSKSVADTPAIRNQIKYEFRFGEQYARIMLLFCMTMMFLPLCPLITPFGLLFFITKHYVDRHNLLFAYNPSKINKKVHSTAISFVILSVVMMQFFMMVFTIVRSGPSSLMAKIMVFIFFISVNVFSAQLWADTCKKFSPIEYILKPYFKDSDKENSYVYLPDILKGNVEEFHPDPNNTDPCSSQGYGTFRSQ